MTAPPRADRRLRVVLAEDQGMVLGAFAALLELQPDVEVVATASDGEEALAAVAAHRPDVLLTDIECPAAAAWRWPRSCGATVTRPAC